MLIASLVSHIFGKCLSDHAFAYLVIDLFCEIFFFFFGTGYFKLQGADRPYLNVCIHVTLIWLCSPPWIIWTNPFKSDLLYFHTVFGPGLETFLIGVKTVTLKFMCLLNIKQHCSIIQCQQQLKKKSKRTRDGTITLNWYWGIWFI